VLLASALKLLEAPSVATGVAAVVVGVILLFVQRVVDRRSDRSAELAATEQPVTNDHADLSEV
jgi:nitrate reductase gamma subunit